MITDRFTRWLKLQRRVTIETQIADIFFSGQTGQSQEPII